MSLYNALFGENPMSDFLLKIVNINKEDVPRYRDCFLNEEGNIVVYTRTGGGNRECFAENGDCSSCYHTANDELSENKYFVTDYDDDYDSTYAYFVFKPSKDYELILKTLTSKEPLKEVGEKFKDLVSALQSGEQTTDTIKALTIAKDVFSKLNSGIKIIEI